MKRIIRNTTVLFLIVAWMMTSIHPLQAQRLSLDSVLAIVGRNNLMLREYDERENALTEYARGAKSWMAPMIGVGTFMRPYPGQEVMHENEKGAWMFSVEQNIPNPFTLTANKNFYESRSAVEKEARNVQLNILRSEAKSNFYQWTVNEKRLKVLNESERIIELMLDLARIRYPYNQGTLGSIYMAEGRLSEIKNMQLMTQGEIEEASMRLKALMNLSPTDSITVDTSISTRFNVLQVSSDTVALASRRSDIRQIERSIESMRLNQAVQKAKARPEFKIRFDHMEPVGDMPRQYTAMAMISIPIAPWSSRMYHSEIKGMDRDIAAMQKGRQAILQEARGMVAGMAAKLNRMNQLLNNYEEKIIPALEKNHKTVMASYEENREQLPSVIAAWEAVNMSQMEYLDKLQEYYIMIIAYEKEIEQ